VSNISELLFIVTYYAYLGVRASESLGHLSVSGNVLRVFQIFRVFQIVRLLRYSPTLRLVIQTWKRCKDAFLLLFAILLVIIIVCASLMFYAEQSGETFNQSKQEWTRDIDGSVSPFQSIADCMWWAIVTVTTVGYGDVYPVTPIGKVVASFTMIISLLTLALPIGVFGAYFNEAWQSRQEKQSLTTVTSVELSSEDCVSGKIDLQDRGILLVSVDRLQLEIMGMLREVTNKQEQINVLLQKLNKPSG